MKANRGKGGRKTEFTRPAILAFLSTGPKTNTEIVEHCLSLPGCHSKWHDYICWMLTTLRADRLITFNKQTQTYSLTPLGHATNNAPKTESLSSRISRSAAAHKAKLRSQLQGLGFED